MVDPRMAQATAVHTKITMIATIRFNMVVCASRSYLLSPPPAQPNVFRLALSSTFHCKVQASARILFAPSARPVACPWSLAVIHQALCSAILIATSGRRNESLSHPPSQGAPCSRCDSIPSSTRTLTSLPTGGNIRPTRATSTPTSSPAAVCLTKPCSPCCSTSSNPISPARSSPSTTSRRPAASHTPISAATQNPLTTKDSNLSTPSTVGACLCASV